MLDMKFEAQYMNDMLNRNYELDVDEDELDDELAEFEREIAMDKKKAVNVNTNKNPQQTNTNYKNQDIESMMKGLWIAWFTISFVLISESIIKIACELKVSRLNFYYIIRISFCLTCFDYALCWAPYSTYRCLLKLAWASS